jgi:hypothetical protein
MDKSVATEADIRKLAHEYITHTIEGESVKGTYLRYLAGTTIKELGVDPRANNATQRKRLSDDDRARHLAALAAVHARFYEVINDEVDKSLGSVPPKERATEKNRRTNFARTALYALRLYIRAGKDLTAVAPAKLSKSALAVDVVRPDSNPTTTEGPRGACLEGFREVSTGAFRSRPGRRRRRAGHAHRPNGEPACSTGGAGGA